MVSYELTIVVILNQGAQFSTQEDKSDWGLGQEAQPMQCEKAHQKIW